MLRRYEKGRLIWVAPGAVRYTREEIDLLLPWLEEMREGAYPSEPSGGYVEGQPFRRSQHAYYEAACQVAGEIDTRLGHLYSTSRPGLDRYLVEQFCIHNVSDEELAIRLFIPTKEVRRRINSGLSYISSGPCPRWLNCIYCHLYKTCHKKIKGRPGVSYKEWVEHRRCDKIR